MYLIVFISLMLALGGTSILAKAASVDLPQGVITGVEAEGIQVFKGIPYAQPPVGAQRWQPPRPIEPGEIAIAADQYGPMCLQKPNNNQSKLDMSEDCLSLNIWSKELGSKQPVMVWIHGGGFRGGSNRIAGEVFAKKDNVVVSMNYRLGPLGFFAHESLDQPTANFGLLDLELALKWVQQNIHSFGGDPDNVTIFGVSAGGQIVNLLMVSPRARGLFHRAISQSGYATWPLPRGRNAPNAGPLNLFMKPALSAEQMDRKLIASINSNDQTRDMLMSLEGEKLINAQTGFRLPIVDGESLLEEPGILFLRGMQASVPLMTGGNSYEGSVMGGTTLTPTDIVRSTGEDFDIASALYSGDPEGIWQRRLFGDMRYLLSSLVTADAMKKSPTWLYFIDFLAASQAGQPGTAHGSDAWFIYSGSTSADPAVRELSGRMIEYWSQFARYGNPNSPNLSAWPSYNKQTRSWLIFDEFDRVGRAILDTKLGFHERRYLERVSLTVKPD